MRIVDRHVLYSFLRNYVLTLLVLIGLYIALDMVLNFDEFAVDDRTGRRGAAGVVASIAGYYGAQTLLIFTQLAGVVPVIAAAFTLMRLSRNNEFTALLAAGVPLLRVALPIGVAAVVLTLLTLVGHELVIPRFIDQLTRERGDDAGGEAFRVEGLPLNVAGDGGSSGGLLYAGRFLPGDTPRMLGLTLIEHDGTFAPTTITTADEATWDPADRLWQLDGGRREPVATRGSVAAGVPVSVLELPIDPALIQLLQE